MGKQIEFFMTKLDELEFLKMVVENGYLIMDDKASVIEIDEVIESSTLSSIITFKNSKICKSENDFLDVIESEVIEFSRSLNRSDNSMLSGRIWGEFKYYNSSQELIAKSKQMNDMYNILVKWIKKNMRQSKCKNFFAGSDAYRFYKINGYKMLAGPKHIIEFE